MFYGEYDVITHINDEATIGRLIIGRMSIKLVRAPGTAWRLASIKLVPKSEPPVNPTWKSKPVDGRLPEFEVEAEARLFDEVSELLLDANHHLGLQEVSNDPA